VSARARRRRALLLLSLALACGGLAASQVAERVRSVERRVGPMVPVVVTAHDLPADRRIGGGDLAVRRVPERFAPRDALAAASDAAGLRAAVAVPAGTYLTSSQLRRAGGEPGGGLGRGQRAVEVAMAGGEALAGTVEPGARVDVVVSTEPRDGAGRSFLALEDVELLALRPGTGQAGEGSGARTPPSAVATLRVTLRQAVYLTAAQNFAREVRLFPRPPGDRGRAGRAEIGAGGL
jgi:pilus assembly protein CpaB